MSDKKIRVRVLAALPGIECHDKGMVVICNALRNAGVEVIYLGKFNTPEKIVRSAIEEDIDVVALSYLSDHLYMVFFPKVVELLKENKAGDICVVVGGRISEEDIPALRDLGITGFFNQGTPLKEIVDHIMERVEKKRGESP